MNVTECELAGLLLIEPKVFGDLRGFFLESWNRKRYRAAGIPDDFVQDNFSFSRQGTLRGLHFQNPRPQGKLVSVWQGEVWDVAVDLRRQSPTFGRWLGASLSAENKRQFYVPPGFAHGFVVLSEAALFHYKCTNDYSPKHPCSGKFRRKNCSKCPVCCATALPDESSEDPFVWSDRPGGLGAPPHPG